MDGRRFWAEIYSNVQIDRQADPSKDKLETGSQTLLHDMTWHNMIFHDTDDSHSEEPFYCSKTDELTARQTDRKNEKLGRAHRRDQLTKKKPVAFFVRQTIEKYLKSIWVKEFLLSQQGRGVKEDVKIPRTKQKTEKEMTNAQIGTQDPVKVVSVPAHRLPKWK